MKIDNSQLSAFTTCPLFWFERYYSGIQKPATWTAFGTRWHELIEERMRELAGWNGQKYGPSSDETLELEAQAMYAAYLAQYSVEPFEVIAVERTFELPIPGTKHVYIGKFDGIIRNNEYGWLQLFETKSEKRNSPRNSPKAWNARTQASLYLWAARQLYREETVNSILLNVCTRGSDGGKIGPVFRRDILERSDEQVTEALWVLCWVADQIERCLAEGYFPRFTESCMDGRYECEYYTLHNIGDAPEVREALYVSTKPYLSL